MDAEVIEIPKMLVVCLFLRLYALANTFSRNNIKTEVYGLCSHGSSSFGGTRPWLRGEGGSQV